MGLFNFLFGHEDKAITFGMHKGKKYSELSSNYLLWLSQNMSNGAEKIAKKELNRRKKNKSNGSENAIVGIITSKRKCWKCKKSTQIIALKFYRDSEVPNKEFENPIIMYGQKNLPQGILEVIQSKFPFYKSKYSHTIQSKYIANTCEYCSALQGDFYLHEEPDGAFFNAFGLKPKYYIGLIDNKLGWL